jgi:hypothetical protein
MTYTLHYVSEDMESGDHPGDSPRPAGTWSVYSEQYEDFTDEEPIEGSTEVVSRNHPTFESASVKADALQRRSYAENRKARNG